MEKKILVITICILTVVCFSLAYLLDKEQAKNIVTLRAAVDKLEEQKDSLQIFCTDKKGNILGDPNFNLNNKDYRLNVHLSAKVFDKSGRVINNVDRFGTAFLNQYDSVDVHWKINLGDEDKEFTIAPPGKLSIDAGPFGEFTVVPIEFNDYCTSAFRSQKIGNTPFYFQTFWDPENNRLVPMIGVTVDKL